VTGGFLPVLASIRPGRKPTIQPSTAGRSFWTSMSMRFCPGWILSGPNLYFRTWAPGGGPGSLTGMFRSAGAFLKAEATAS
jgi:hypothetical protein